MQSSAKLEGTTTIGRLFGAMVVREMPLLEGRGSQDEFP